MSINLDKFKYDLVEGWREVMDSKNPINWAIFGYDGQTFDLKLISKGFGGVEDMVDGFNSGRIMYGLCRVKLKDKNIDKVLLINWQGEGAPMARKGTCANHVGTVKNFFKGIHVVINARTDEDIDPDLIISTLSKSSSVDVLQMSSSSSSTDLDSKSDPIGANYKKVNPQEEINSKVKDEFWKNEEKEEERRKRTEVEKEKSKRFSQNEVKLLRKESQEYFNEQEKIESSPSLTPSPTPSPTPLTFSPQAPTPPQQGWISANGNGTNGNGHHNISSSNSSCSGRNSTSPHPPFSNSFISAEKAAVLKASAPKKNNASENLVRQRIKSFDGNHDAVIPSPAQNDKPSFNGFSKSFSPSIPTQSYLNKGPYSSPPISNNVINESNKGNEGPKSPEKSPVKEKISVLKRKELFESGCVSNSGAVIVRKNPAEEIKVLQEESKRANNNSVKSPSPPPEIKSPLLSAPSNSTNPTSVKAYNIPFVIGGGVSSRLADKINKNSELSSTNAPESSVVPKVSGYKVDPGRVFFDDVIKRHEEERKLRQESKAEKFKTEIKELAQVKTPDIVSSSVISESIVEAQSSNNLQKKEEIVKEIKSEIKNETSPEIPTPIVTQAKAPIKEERKPGVTISDSKNIIEPPINFNSKIEEEITTQKIEDKTDMLIKNETSPVVEFMSEPVVQHIVAVAQEETKSNEKKNDKLLCEGIQETPRVKKSPSPNRIVYEDNSVTSAQSSSPQPAIVKKSDKVLNTTITPEMGLCARALYDYQAADESEITFDPGDMITNIETIDEGWWEGMGPQGLYGLFPANYVELLN